MGLTRTHRCPRPHLDPGLRFQAFAVASPPIPQAPRSSPQPPPVLKSRGCAQGVSRLSSRFQDKGEKIGGCWQLSGLLENPKPCCTACLGEPERHGEIIQPFGPERSELRGSHCRPIVSLFLSFRMHIPTCMYTKCAYKNNENVSFQISCQSDKISLFGWVILQFPLLL